MIKHAKQYAEQRRSRSVVYAANRFVRLVDDRPPQKLDRKAVDRYVAACQETGLSAATIKSSVRYLLALARHHGVEIVPPKISVPRPRPEPVPVSSIDAVWESLAPWCRQFVALTYWTGLRLADVLTLQLEIHDRDDIGETISHTASKTGRHFIYPVPQWLRAFVKPHSLPFGAAADYAAKITRATIAGACKKTGTPPFLPKHIRQRSITEWQTADGTAGSIVHGSGLDILDHYVDPLTILTAAAPRVKLPDCFGARTDQPDVLPLFRRLDPAGQQLILSTMERLA